MDASAFPQSKRLVYFGTEAYSQGPLAALIAAGANITAVITKPDAPSGRGRTLTPPAIKTLAEGHHLPVWQPQHLRDIIPQLTQLKPTAGVLVAYGKIIPPALLELFPQGIINIHPSLLPRYRGPAPIEAAILGGDRQTGVTLMRLDTGMDTGPIYAQATLNLTGHETRQELYDRLFDLGSTLLLQHLPAILNGSLTPTPQPHTGATVTRLLTKADGQLDLSKSAEQLTREIRAYLGWPGSRTLIYGQEALITAAQAVPAGASVPLGLPTGQDQLNVLRLKPAGKRDMSAAEFLAGRHPG